MAAKHHRHVTPTEPLSRFIERQVARWRYASASEAVRAGPHLLIEREEAGARPTKEDGEADE
jgi:putative addiction module CopG family antidote